MQITNMKEFAIYTVLTGGYDDILQPKVIDSRFDYILFSNDIKDGEAGIWSVRPIPLVVNDSGKRLSRYPKTHPEELLSDYKASLYIDANIFICDQWVYDRFVELYNNQIEYAGVKLVLTGSDCIYEHSFDMCQTLVEHDYVAIKQCHKLYEQGFPQHFGLNENNVIFRIHTEKMKKTDEEWWDWILNYSNRDQFSYMFCLWKNNVVINYFLPEGEDARNGEHFHLVSHNKGINKKKVIKRGFIEKFRIKSRSFQYEKSKKRWVEIIKSPHPILSLYLNGAASILYNIPNFIKLLIKGK